MQKIAMGEDLRPFAKALEAAGFQVVALDPQTLHSADAVVVDGMDHAFLGIETVDTDAPVIDADGMTSAEVVAAVKKRALSR